MPVLSFTSTAQSLEDIFIKLVNDQYMLEDDPAIPQKKQKKAKEDSPAEEKGRAYYGAEDDETTPVTEEEYTPLFTASEDTDDTDEDGKEDNE